LNAGAAGQVAGSCCWRSGRGHNRRLVNRTGSSLRHYHATRRQSSCWRRSVCVTLRAVRRDGGRIGGRLGFKFFSEDWRAFLQYGGGGIVGSWSGGSSCLNRNGGRRNRRGCHRRRSNRRHNGLLGRDCNRRNRRNSHHWRLDCGGWLLGCTRMIFAVRRGHWRLHHDGYRWRYHHHRSRNHNRARRGLGNHRAGRRTRSDCRRRRRSRNNGRRGSRLRHNLAGLRAPRRWRCDNRNRRGPGRRRRRRLWTRRRMALPRILFLFLLVGQNGLHYVAGLGYVREIDFWRDALRGTCSRGTSVTARSAVQMHANLLRLVILQRTGVGLAVRQAELRQYVKNLPALDFHLACEIVDSNLTHPPLFKLCYPKPLVAHSYLMALAALCISLIARLALKSAAHPTRRPLWPPALA
jgi:hypothetical protein